MVGRLCLLCPFVCRARGRIRNDTYSRTPARAPATSATSTAPRAKAPSWALAENPFNAAGMFQTNSEHWSRETFIAPGASRAVVVGLRYALD